MLKLNSVSKQYNDHFVIKNFSCQFHSGKRYLLTGESGIGKTTLLNLISGIIKPDLGTVETTESFSYAFQFPRLFEYYDVLSNVLRFTKASKEAVSDALQNLNMPECLQQKVCDLSGGQKQRINIIIAMLAHSDCVLLDEPFASLDEDNRQLVIDFILKHQKNRTLIISSHQKDRLADYDFIEINLQ